MERSLADAASFSNVTDLSLSFASPTSRCRFDPHVVDALSRLTLESLSLTNIGDVCVSAIAKRCRGLERLGLIECVVLDEDIDENAVFQCLRILLIRQFPERTDILRTSPLVSLPDRATTVRRCPHDGVHRRPAAVLLRTPDPLLSRTAHAPHERWQSQRPLWTAGTSGRSRSHASPAAGVTKSLHGRLQVAATLREPRAVGRPAVGRVYGLLCGVPEDGRVARRNVA
ncbi:hypothetical protein HPB49_018566 [Dermacentor silvarum]|uniref:Uncharacterized protein n=1 Tax=Dermacentor silvarum TaxID=543639 RepID=A0ACB8C555_DERSI|nr:hypothetical protein HPB49_018566 [Dermacentor silvarum]